MDAGGLEGHQQAVREDCMVKQQTICDRCGQEKKGANHWWEVYGSPVIPDALVIRPAGPSTAQPGAVEVLGAPGDFCSQVCALRAIDEWMSKQIAEAKAEEKLSQEAAEANA